MAAQTRRVDAWVLAAAQSGAVTVREWCLVALAKHPSPSSPGALDSFDADMSVMCVAAAGAELTSSSSSSSSSGSGGHGAGGGARGPDLPALLAELLIQVPLVPPSPLLMYTPCRSSQSHPAPFCGW